MENLKIFIVFVIGIAAVIVTIYHICSSLGALSSEQQYINWCSRNKQVSREKKIYVSVHKFMTTKIFENIICFGSTVQNIAQKKSKVRFCRNQV